MELPELSNKVLSQFSKSITDKVFLLIQSDKELMNDYLRTVQEKGLDVTNRHLGKAIKSRFNLDNDSQREDFPTSTLIKSYQQFQ
jgi:hypothetical protein